MEPKIRLKGFIGDWGTANIGTIAPITGGYAFQSNCFVDNGIPIVRISNILDSGVVGGNFAFYDSFPGDEQFKLYKDDIVIAMSGATTGKVAIIKDEKTYYQNQRVGKFSKTGKVDYSYLSTIVSSDKFLKELYRLLTASAQPNASSKDIDSISIPLPQYRNEQEAIASYFTNLDTFIQSTTKKIESLNQIKAASLQSMFPQEGETKPRVRFKCFEDDWVPTLIGDCGTWSKGRLLSKEDITPKGKTKCIHYGELFTLYGEVIKKVQSKTDLQEGCISQIGDILFPDSDVTPTGLARCSALMEEGVILGGGINILKPQKHIHSPFLSYAINMEKEQIISRVTGTTVRHINSRALSEVVVILPQDIKEQQAIANYFTNFDTQITLQTQRLEKLKQIKSACLDNMFV